MVISVNTDVGAMLALQALRKTTSQIAVSTMRITTGLKVNGPADDPGTFAIALNLRGEIAGVTAVRNMLSLGKSTVDVAIDGATAVADLLTEMKAKAVQGSQAGLDAATQSSLHIEFTALRDQLGTVVGTADFNAKNLIESGASNFQILSSVDGSVIVVTAQPMDPTTLAIHTAALSNASQAGTAVTAINTAITTVSAALSSLGSAARGVEITQEFTSKLVDVLKEALGSMIDADLAEETALLEALKIKEQLGVQALSIANGFPEAILNLLNA